jgi:hypothetical protein
MTQDFQTIGGVSPALERVALQHQGWLGGDDAESPALEVTDQSDYSFRDKHAGLRALGFQSTGDQIPDPAASVPNWQAADVGCMAAVQVSPFDPQLPDENTEARNPMWGINPASAGRSF